MKKFFPILDWLPNYKKEYLSGDVSAGLTVGVMLVPQGIAYAMVAGLPPVYGLYAAMIPQLVYAVFGTSRQLAVGPVAMDSLLVAAAVSAIAVVGSENYIALAILLSLMMGVIQVIFGVLKMGFLVNFLSKPVLSGFTSAAAVIIGLGQLKHLLGIDLGKNNDVFKIIEGVVLNFGLINWIAVSIGVISIIVIKSLKKVHRAIPGALVAVVLGVLVEYFGQFSSLGVKIVGDIPQGLPSFSIPDITNDKLGELIPVAFTLALIAFMEAISVAKSLHSKHKEEYDLDNNQEMIGLGMSNVVGSFFGCYPTTGGFSRSAVNEEAGAKTNLSAIVSAVLIAVTLLFLTPVFYHLPKAILGAIIIVAVFGLIDISFSKFLWKTSKQEFSMLLGTFVVTLFFGIKEGIGVGVLISLLALVYRTSRPHIAVLGRLIGTEDYRNISRFKEIELREDVLIIRQDAQLYFANVSNFVEAVKEEAQKKGEGLKLIVFDASSVSSVDTTALEGLKELIEYQNSNGVGFYFTGVIGPVRDFFHKTGFTKELGWEHFFIDIPAAIDYLDHGAREKNKQMLKRAVQTNVFDEGI